MKIDIEKKDLLTILGKTQNIVEKKTTMPILSNVLLEVDASSLLVFATDLEVSLTAKVKVLVQEQGRVAVNARNLFDIVKELSDESLQLSKTENNWIEIKQGRYQSKIVGIHPDEYPVFPTYVGNNFQKMNALLLKEMIDKTIYSVSNDETRYQLNGVYFEQKPDQSCIMVATDGHRLSLISRTTTKTTNLILSNQGVIIPKKGLNEIRKLLEFVDMNKNSDVDIAVEGSQLILNYDQTILMVRLIEGKYPNYTQFIPTKAGKVIRLNRESFLTSIKRVSLLANQKSKVITFALSSGKMEISSNNPELGDAKEEFEIAYSGKTFKIGFNAKYLQDVLSVIQENEVELEINDHLSPGLVRPFEDHSYTCVVMPMRI